MLTVPKIFKKIALAYDHLTMKFCFWLVGKKYPKVMIDPDLNPFGLMTSVKAFKGTELWMMFREPDCDVIFKYHDFQTNVNEAAVYTIIEEC